MHNENQTKILIDEHDFTYEKIAARVGCSSMAVRNWYQGKRPMKVYRERLEKIFRRVTASR